MSTSLEGEILEFGRGIFAEIGKQQPSAFNKNFWIGRIMEWSMAQPAFKLNMFRLVDVLPSLHSAPAIASHVNEYLGSVGANIHALVDWGLNAPPTSLRARATSVIVRKGVQQMASLFIGGENA